MPLNAVTASAATPDEQVLASIANTHEVTVSLAGGYIHRATAQDLQRQLARLMPQLIRQRQIAYYRELSRDAGRDIKQESPESREDKAYVVERSKIEATGGTTSSVELVTIGLDHWTATVAADWRNGAGEEEFCRAASAAASELMRSFFHQARKLKVSIYS